MSTDALGYIRVSTREQADSGLSLAAQTERIAQFCEFKGLTLINVVEDSNVSGSVALKDRRGGAELLKLTSEKPYTVVAIKLDRLFRDAHDCLGVTKHWQKSNNQLHLLDLGVDTGTAMGRAFLTNAAAYAELERNLIADRTREALRQIRLQGGVLGADRYGWSRTENLDEHGRKVLAPNPQELGVVIECKVLRKSGLTYQQIADKFNSENKPTKRGGKWFPSTVRNCYNSQI